LDWQESRFGEIKQLDQLINSTAAQLSELKNQSCDIRGKFESSTTKENATIAARLIATLLEKIETEVAAAQASLVRVEADEAPYVLLSLAFFLFL
jgi:hypothetical protein